MKRALLNQGVAVTLCLSLITPMAFAQGPTGASPQRPAPARAPTSGSAKPLSEALSGVAKSEYDSGRILYGDGDYHGALLKFQRAYELSKDGRLLWNMAVCEKNLRHYARVLRLVRQYQREAGPLMNAQDRQEASDLVAAVQSFVSPLWVRVDEPGASISVDDEPMATTPMTEPVLVDLGVHRVKVSKPGYTDVIRTIKVEGLTEITLSIRLEKESHQGRLVITAGPGDTIWLDGKVVGENHWEASLLAGGHTVQVTSPGKRTYQTEVVVRENQTRDLRITLESEGAATSSTSTWLWIAGGAALVAGTAVGAYFLFKPSDQAAPAPIPGTIQPGTIQLPLWGR